MNANLSNFSTDEIEQELARRQSVREELQRRIYSGELEATDGDSAVSMGDLS